MQITCLYDMDIVFGPDGNFDEVYLYEELMEADLHAIVRLITFGLSRPAIYATHLSLSPSPWHLRSAPANPSRTPISSHSSTRHSVA
jgi:hypothetical protein